MRGQLLLAFCLLVASCACLWHFQIKPTIDGRKTIDKFNKEKKNEQDKN